MPLDIFRGTTQSCPKESAALITTKGVGTHEFKLLERESLCIVVLKEEVIPRKGYGCDCSTGENLAICCNCVRFWVHSDIWNGVIELHI